MGWSGENGEIKGEGERERATARAMTNMVI